MKQFLTLLILFQTIALTASDNVVTGIVLDAETKEPLPFANIAIMGQSRGTVSNIEGRFVLDRKGFSLNDTVAFSYMGYETLKLSVNDFKNQMTIHLQTASINLKEISILSRSLTVKEIIALVEENYYKNHPKPSQKQRIFYHKYEKVPFPKENQITVKRSDFVGLNKDTFDEIYELLPPEFIEYQDALVELNNDDGEQKLTPIQAISMEEGAMKDLGKKMEKLLGAFLEDIEETKDKEDIYYKFRTGIFAGKMDDDSNENDSTWENQKNDSLYYHVSTWQVKSEINFLFDQYADFESDNWEFLKEYRKYDYTLGDITIFNDELVYPITFKPKNETSSKKGLFKGVMYIATDSYAVVQLDFEYATGKRSENFQLLGVGHSMNYKKGQVIYEKEDSGYFVKYIYAQQKETASIDRDFSIMKKKKRFLFDKELNEIKLEIELYFDINSYWELLVEEREIISSTEFEKITEPNNIKFKKEYAYSPETWENMTVIAPTSELKKYKRNE